MKENKGQFKNGNPGKQPGTQNKLTRTVKETVLAVFNDLQSHPTASLKAWAQKNPKDFYPIAAKLIPTEINAKLGKINLVIVRHDKINDTERNLSSSQQTSSESTESI